MTDYTVSTDVAISKTLATVTTSCPYVTAKLSGSDSDWADALTACTSCEDLDGYKIELTQSVYFEAFTFTSPTSIDHIGGCIATATTASAVCITASAFASPAVTAVTAAAATCKMSTGATDTDCTAAVADQATCEAATDTVNSNACVWTAAVQAVTAAAAGASGYRLGAGATGWVTTTAFAAAKASTTATALPSSTAITEASNYIVLGSACQAATYDAAASSCAFAASTTITPTTTGATTAGSTMTHSWYQPDENSDGYTDTMPRFSAEEDTVHFYGFLNQADGGSYVMTDCGSGILMGASTLLAGAAVAFGAAALAF